jgi:Transposase DDE domain
MERELFRWVQRALRALRRRRPRGQRFSDADIVLVAFWAAIHDRSISWACQRRNWPASRFARALPDQSTMSRRLRTHAVASLVRTIILAIASLWRPSTLAVLDGRALPISRFSNDPHARPGYARGSLEKGYRLHTLADGHDGRVLAHAVTPLSTPEPIVARTLLSRARKQGLLDEHAFVLADAGYDTNHLHQRASDLGLRLFAPRRRPGTSLGHSTKQTTGRLVSILATEHNPALAREIGRARRGVERVFSRQVCTGGGLRDLPAWARRMPRVRLWTDLKVLAQALVPILKPRATTTMVA